MSCFSHERTRCDRPNSSQRLNLFKRDWRARWKDHLRYALRCAKNLSAGKDLELPYVPLLGALNTAVRLIMVTFEVLMPLPTWGHYVLMEPYVLLLTRQTTLDAFIKIVPHQYNSLRRAHTSKWTRLVKKPGFFIWAGQDRSSVRCAVW